MRDIHTIFPWKMPKNSAWSPFTMQLIEMLPLVVTSIVSLPKYWLADLSPGQIFLKILFSLSHERNRMGTHLLLRCSWPSLEIWSRQSCQSSIFLMTFMKTSFRFLLKLFILSSFTCIDTRNNNKGKCLFGFCFVHRLWFIGFGSLILSHSYFLFLYLFQNN